MTRDQTNNAKKLVSYELNMSKSQLLAKIQERIKNYSWTDLLLANTVDYKEFEIESEKIKIKRRPANLTTWGEIDLFVEEIESNKTRLNFNIISFHELFPWARGLMITFGVFFTILGLLIDRSTTSLLIIVLCWVVVSLFVHLRLRLESYMMTKYTELIVRDLR